MRIKKQRPLVLGYSPWGNGDRIEPFNKIFQYRQNVEKAGFKGIDALVLWGGTDIHPSFYKAKPHRTNQTWGQHPSKRDVFEWKAIKFCVHHEIPIIGICRGAQLLCAAAGGKLIQHVENHMGWHSITFADGSTSTTNSLHHQMMYPFDVDHDLIAWSSKRLSACYEEEVVGVNNLTMLEKPEPEIVWFPQLQGLAIQGHPEGYSPPPDFERLCCDLVEKYLDFDKRPDAKPPLSHAS